MPAPDPTELRDFIDEALGEKLKRMEGVERRRHRKTRTFGAFLLLILVPTGFITTILFGVETVNGQTDYSGLYEYPLMMVAVFLGLFVPYHLWKHSRPRPFEYNADVVSSLIYYLDPRLSYRPDGGISETEIHNSGIPEAPIRRFESSDLATGTLRDIELHFGRVAAYESRWKNPFKYSFQGVFLHARLPRTYNSTTVLPGLSGEERTNQLSESQSERLQTAEHIWREEIPKSASSQLSMILREDKVYLAIPIADLFDPGPALQLGDTEKLHRVAKVLMEAITVVESLARS